MPKVKCTYCGKEIDVPPGPVLLPICENEECRKKRLERPRKRG